MSDNDKKDASTLTNKDLVNLGDSALKVQYLSLLNRVKAQENLTSSEIKTLQALKEFFADQAKLDDIESAPPVLDTNVLDLPDPATLQTPQPKTVPNLLRATEHLQASGWSVKKSTLYNHKKSGLITPNAAGEYPTDALEAYAAENLRRLDGRPASPIDKEAAALVLVKQRATAEIAVEQARLLKNRNRDQEAEFLSLIWTELAARATILNNDLGNFYRSKTLEIINLVNGDPVRAPELVDYLLASLAAVMARYTLNKTFHVQFEAYSNLVDTITSPDLADPAFPHLDLSIPETPDVDVVNPNNSSQGDPK